MAAITVARRRDGGAHPLISSRRYENNATDKRFGNEGLWWNVHGIMNQAHYCYHFYWMSEFGFWCSISRHSELTLNWIVEWKATDKEPHWHPNARKMKPFARLSCKMGKKTKPNSMQTPAFSAFIAIASMILAFWNVFWLNICVSFQQCHNSPTNSPLTLNSLPRLIIFTSFHCRCFVFRVCCVMSLSLS